VHKVERWERTNFKKAWFLVAIKKVRDKFHCKFQASFKAHPFEYKGVNLGFTTTNQIKAKDRAINRACVKVMLQDKDPP
jgi:hypothetical protein